VTPAVLHGRSSRQQRAEGLSVAGFRSHDREELSNCSQFFLALLLPNAKPIASPAKARPAPPAINRTGLELLAAAAFELLLVFCARLRAAQQIIRATAPEYSDYGDHWSPRLGIDGALRLIAQNAGLSQHFRGFAGSFKERRSVILIDCVRIVVISCAHLATRLSAVRIAQESTTGSEGWLENPLPKLSLFHRKTEADLRGASHVTRTR
jgi:hypothetical protein